MKNKLITLAVLGAFASVPAIAVAEEAPAAAAAPASPHTFTYNLGLFSQYVWRGMTQTDESAALQGGVDYAHSSGFYAGAWASNVSWTTDLNYMKSNSLELDLYGGYANTIGSTGIGYNVGLLQYVYPGTGFNHVPDADATEIYGALSYKWVNAKYSYTVSDEAWGFGDAQGSGYLEANADIPIGESGFTVNLHVGSFMFDGDVGGFDNDHYDYEDWKVGVTKAWDNGVKLGAAYTDNNADKSHNGTALWVDEMRSSQVTVFVQKLF
jgi:uncharacterized protein (TIGR02001 family)